MLLPTGQSKNRKHKSALGDNRDHTLYSADTERLAIFYWTSQRKEELTSLPGVQPGVTAAARDPKLADSPTTCGSQSQSLRVHGE